MDNKEELVQIILYLSNVAYDNLLRRKINPIFMDKINAFIEDEIHPSPQYTSKFSDMYYSSVDCIKIFHLQQSESTDWSNYYIYAKEKVKLDIDLVAIYIIDLTMYLKYGQPTVKYPDKHIEWHLYNKLKQSLPNIFQDLLYPELRDKFVSNFKQRTLRKINSFALPNNFDTRFSFLL